MLGILELNCSKCNDSEHVCFLVIFFINICFILFAFSLMISPYINIIQWQKIRTIKYTNTLMMSSLIISNLYLLFSYSLYNAVTYTAKRFSKTNDSWKFLYLLLKGCYIPCVQSKVPTKTVRLKRLLTFLLRVDNPNKLDLIKCCNPV